MVSASVVFVVEVSDLMRSSDIFSSLSARMSRGELTGTVWSGATKMCFTNPCSVDSISKATLSVSSSKITSPFLTWSPSLTWQAMMTASCIDGLSFGNMTSFAINDLSS